MAATEANLARLTDLTLSTAEALNQLTAILANKQAQERGDVTTVPAATSPQFRWQQGEKQRTALMPIRHEDIWAFRKKIEGLHWTAQEVDLSKDKADWTTRMDADQRHFVAMQLGFFAGADLWVLDNLAENFSQEIDCLEANMAFAAQMDQECTHAESYSLQIEAVMSGEERDNTMNAAEHMPAVRKMRDWAFRWFDRGIDIGERLVAWAIFEGVLFSASFASLQWLREANLLTGITEYNTFIVRDEGVHTLHACLYVRRYLVNRPSAARVYEIFDGAIETLDDFVDTSLPVRLIGMNADLMRTYVRFQADCVIEELGYEPRYRVENPFPFMDKLSLNEVAKANFFERNSTQYQSVTRAGASNFALDDSEVVC